MDLNVNNYTISDLINTFNLSEDNLDLKNLDSGLSDKMNQIKIIDEDLPEKKEDLMDFYTKAYLKIKESFNTKRETQEINNFEKSVGNTFDYDLNPEEFINVREKLLPIIQNGPTVQQNNSFVTKHNDLPALNTFNSNLKYGDVNPLTRKSLKKILNINTKFRDNYTITQSTNFNFDLPSAIKKVVSVKLVDSQFPEMVYTVSSLLGSNSFIVNGISIDISNGSYSSTTIVETINKALTNAGLSIELSYNENDGLMTFTDSLGVNFTLNFDYTGNECPQLPSNIYKDQLTLGWLLGFRGNYIKPIASTREKFFCLNLIKNQADIHNKYSGASSYTGESLFDPHGTRYFFISINDYQNNHNNTFISPFKYQTLADNNIIAKVSTECCKHCCVEQPERIYFGPTDIAKLEIKIYDEFGRIVDINNADYSFTLELEVIYDL